MTYIVFDCGLSWSNDSSWTTRCNCAHHGWRWDAYGGGELTGETEWRRRYSLCGNGSHGACVSFSRYIRCRSMCLCVYLPRGCVPLERCQLLLTPHLWHPLCWQIFIHQAPRPPLSVQQDLCISPWLVRHNVIVASEFVQSAGWSFQLQIVAATKILCVIGLVPSSCTISALIQAPASRRTFLGSIPLIIMFSARDDSYCSPPFMLHICIYI